MADIEKIIKGLETCIPMKYETAEDKECRHEQCPYGRENHKTIDGCIWDLMGDALELLKEHKAVEPHYNARTNWYECGVCHYSMTSGMHCRGELIPAYKVGFCAKCGQEVKWK